MFYTISNMPPASALRGEISSYTENSRICRGLSTDVWLIHVLDHWARRVRYGGAACGCAGRSAHNSRVMYRESHNVMRELLMNWSERFFVILFTYVLISYNKLCTKKMRFFCGSRILDRRRCFDDSEMQHEFREWSAGRSSLSVRSSRLEARCCWTLGGDCGICDLICNTMKPARQSSRSAAISLIAAPWLCRM